MLVSLTSQQASYFSFPVLILRAIQYQLLVRLPCQLWVGPLRLHLNDRWCQSAGAPRQGRAKVTFAVCLLQQHMTVLTGGLRCYRASSSTEDFSYSRDGTRTHLQSCRVSRRTQEIRDTETGLASRQRTSTPELRWSQPSHL